MPFYAISAPCGQGDSEGSNLNPKSRVFKTTEEALKALKTNKQSRLKTFENYEDALKFATEPFSVSNETIDCNKSGQYNKIENLGPAPSEGCPFKSLTPQELKKLKQAIADEDAVAFDKLVADNPRYLTTPCDTPSILHSGTRANALHVAATEGGSMWGKASPKMTQKVLDTILDPCLMERMYPGESAEARARRQTYMFDMYLNTPLKGSNDTPLHIAAKYGSLDVVALLVQFSSCDTKRLNKDGLPPADVTGSRMTNRDAEVEKKILQLLSDNLYIPVYRVCDHSQPAYIGEIWSPRRPSLMLSSAKNCQEENKEPTGGNELYKFNDNLANNNDKQRTSIDLDSLSPIMIRHQLEGVKSTLTSTETNLQHIDNESDNSQTSFNSPLPTTNNHSTTPNKKRNKSPLLIGNNRHPSPLVTPKKDIMGPPSKYSPVINNFSECGNLFDSSGYDTSSSSCRSMLSPLSVQAILGPFSNVDEAKKIQREWKKPQSKSNLLRLKDPKKGLEKEGRTLARKYNSSIIEYWSFLETYCDLTTDQGLQQLDHYLHEKMECKVCMTPNFNNTSVETSFQDNAIYTEERRMQKQRGIEQDKMKQLQDVLADLHITPNTDSSFGIMDDDSSVDNILDSTVNRTENLELEHANADSNPLFTNSGKLKLNVTNKIGARSGDNLSDPFKVTVHKVNDALSPTSIWSRTRESNLDVSSASSNESECNPFRFDEDLENIDNPSLEIMSTFRLANEQSSDSEASSFHSVASSHESSILTAEEGTNWIYLLGKTPTETDRQVYEIIKDINVDQYPSINGWKILLETYSIEEREEWQSYERQIKNVTSDLLISQSNIVNDVKSKLLFEDD